MFRRIALAAVIAFAPCAALADDARDATDVSAGIWKLVYNATQVGPMIGGRYVQAYSDRHLHWSDTTRHVGARMLPGDFGQAHCQDGADIAPDEMNVLRDLARAMYALELPDLQNGPNTAFLELVVTRHGRDYIANIVHYPLSGASLDPRLARAAAIFSRYHCPASPPTAVSSSPI
jgi:hypothetical protein